MAAPKSLLKGFARTVADATPNPAKRVTLFDPETRGLALRITPKGRKTFTIVARAPSGKQVWKEVGDAGLMDLEEARALAREGVRRIKAGQEAFDRPEPVAAPDSFETVAGNFLKRHVEATGLRSADEIRRQFDRYILPAWKDRDFVSIRRSDVTKLIDDIEDNSGPVMADRVLATLSKLFNWYASRSDDFTSPVVKGMRRSAPAERARDRVLSHDEIKALWPVLGESGRFGAFVKVLLLTGQRRAKVAEMRWQDIAEDGMWTLPTEAREKNNPGALKLPDAVLDIIRAQMPIDGNPYVFPAARGDGPLSGFAKFKAAIDAKAKLPSWVLHDLRRTARSLMAEAGVRPDLAERVLGHAIAGVEGVYDRHTYTEERADALVRLAASVDRIVNPPAGNVVALKSAG